MTDAPPRRLNQEEVRQWEIQVLERALRSEPWPDQSPGGGLALFSADTDKIKEFVFESAKLPEIRGASQILRDLNESENPPSVRGVFEDLGLNPAKCIIYSGGGKPMTK